MGLSPRDFWAMSLREWSAACDAYVEVHGGAPTAAVTPGEFAAMKRRFPDRIRR